MPPTGKNENDNEKRELVFKEDGQEYAQVIKMLGNGRLEAKCFDGPLRLAHIRGKLRKKVWINQGDIILLQVSQNMLYTSCRLTSLKVTPRIPGWQGRCAHEVLCRRGP